MEQPCQCTKKVSLNENDSTLKNTLIGIALSMHKEGESKRK